MNLGQTVFMPGGTDMGGRPVIRFVSVAHHCSHLAIGGSGSDVSEMSWVALMREHMPMRPYIMGDFNATYITIAMCDFRRYRLWMPHRNGTWGLRSLGGPG